jgi:hypothetical protein
MILSFLFSVSGAKVARYKKIPHGKVIIFIDSRAIRIIDTGIPTAYVKSI